MKTQKKKVFTSSNIQFIPQNQVKTKKKERSTSPQMSCFHCFADCRYMSVYPSVGGTTPAAPPGYAFATDIVYFTQTCFITNNYKLFIFASEILIPLLVSLCHCQAALTSPFFLTVYIYFMKNSFNFTILFFWVT